MPSMSSVLNLDGTSSSRRRRTVWEPTATEERTGAPGKRRSKARPHPPPGVPLLLPGTPATAGRLSTRLPVIASRRCLVPALDTGPLYDSRGTELETPLRNAREPAASVTATRATAQAFQPHRRRESSAMIMTGARSPDDTRWVSASIPSVVLLDIIPGVVGAASREDCRPATQQATVFWRAFESATRPSRPGSSSPR